MYSSFLILRRLKFGIISNLRGYTIQGNLDLVEKSGLKYKIVFGVVIGRLNFVSSNSFKVIVLVTK